MPAISKGSSPGRDTSAGLSRVPAGSFPCKTQGLNQLFAFLVAKGDSKRERERETWEQQAASLERNYKHNSKRAAEFLCKTC